MKFIQARLSDLEYRKVIKQISQWYASSSSVAPRSIAELKLFWNDGSLWLAIDNTRVVGCLLKVPLGQGIFELAGGYVDMRVRDQGILAGLLTATILDEETYVVATFLPWMDIYLREVWKFRTSSLWKIIWRTRGIFLRQRLSLHRLQSVWEQSQGGAVYYLLRSPRI